MALTIICWLLVGLAAGIVGRKIHPALQARRASFALNLGILGSLLGGVVARLLQLGDSPYTSAGWTLSIFGAVILLSIGARGVLFVLEDHRSGLRDRNLRAG